MIDKNAFEERRAALLVERQALHERRATLDAEERSVPDRLREFLELAGRARTLFEMGTAEEKRELVKIATSNREFTGKYVAVELLSPFWAIANRTKTPNGGPQRDIPRTWDALIPQLIEWIIKNDTSLSDSIRELLDKHMGEEGTDTGGELAA
jgi:hypothetical protein